MVSIRMARWSSPRPLTSKMSAVGPSATRRATLVRSSRSRRPRSWRVTRLVGWGSLLMAAGIAGTAAALAGLPLGIAYASWVLAGVGMGVAYSTIFVASLEGAGAGNETTVVAARFVSGRMGIALGSGLGGACVAIATGLHAGLAAGLWGIFGMAVVASLVTAAVAGRVGSSSRGSVSGAVR